MAAAVVPRQGRAVAARDGVARRSRALVCTERKRLVTPHRIGILGGTFDPIHNGHLAIAEACVRRFDLDRVDLVTAGTPPHKRTGVHTAAEDRHRMVELAVQQTSRLRASAVELHRAGPSYTVLTLREIAAAEPGAALFFLVGGDTIPELGAWYRLEEILQLATLVTVTRPGYPERYTPADVPGLPAAALNTLNSHRLAIPPRPESSTLIRTLAAAGRPVRHLVPPAVARYIETRGLYRAAQNGAAST